MSRDIDPPSNPDLALAQQLVSAACEVLAMASRALGSTSDVRSRLALLVPTHAAIDQVEKSSLMMFAIMRDAVVKRAAERGDDPASALKAIEVKSEETMKSCEAQREKLRALEKELRKSAGRLGE